jgi:membrane protein
LAGVLHLSLLWTHVWPVLRWCVSVSFIMTAVETMYFFAPNVKQRFVHTLAGAVFAVAAWLALSFGLGIYFQRFAGLNRTYGVLGGVIALMTWLFWSWFVVLLGAGINGAVLKADGREILPPKLASPQPATPETAPKGDIAA